MWVKMIVLMLTLLSKFSSCTGEDPPYPEDPYWATDLDSKLGANRQLLTFADIADKSPANVSEDCRLSLKILNASLNYRYSQSNRWAFKLLDSSMKVPPGVLLGGSPQYGSFDQCLDVSADPSSWRNLPGILPYNRTIQGQYCISIVTIAAASQKSSFADAEDFLKDLQFGKNVTWRYDLCLPSACSVADYTYLMQRLDSAPFKLKLEGMLCHKQGPTKMSLLQILSISAFVLLGVILIAGTGIDFILRRRRERGGETDTVPETSRLVSTLLCFSVLTNGEKLLTVGESRDSLTVLHGIRFFSTIHIVLGHSYAFTFLLVFGNLFNFLGQLKHFPAPVISNSVMSVDSFFFLSGLLVAYVTLNELKKRKNITWRFLASFYFHRFWRLTPPIFFVMLFTFVWPLLGSGPLWDASTMIRSGRCQLYGWATLFYVQNLFAQKTMCMEHSWYLAVDMQMYLVSPIILISIHRNKSLGLAINSLFLLGVLTAPFLISTIYDLMPHVIYNRNMDVKKIIDLEFSVAQMPYCRMGPFCVGIFLGYFFSCGKDIKIPKWAVWMGWCLAVACNTSVLFAVLPWTNEHMPDKWVGHLYSATCGTAWSLGLAWMTFACATGHGGIVNRILSMKILVPLSRISYMIYLIHPFFIHSFVGQLRERIIHTNYLQATLYLGLLSMSIGCAFVFSLAVEAPFIALEKVLFRRPQNETKKENHTLEQEYKRLIQSEDLNTETQGHSE